MTALLVTLHVLVSFIMIGVVLLQSGKGAEIGAAFGGSSQTIFGSRGPGTFLSKMTVAAAVIFMLTSLSLSILSGQRSVASSVIDFQKKESPVAEPPAVQLPSSSPAESGQLPEAAQTPQASPPVMDTPGPSADPSK